MDNNASSNKSETVPIRSIQFVSIYPLIQLLCYMLVSCSVSNQFQKSTFIIVMMQTVVLQNKWPSQIRAINYSIHKSLSNSYKMPRLWANSAVFKIKPACEERPFAPQHSSPSHVSTLVRNYLHWQGWVSPDKNPQRLDFPFIWLWFTRPFWPRAPFTTNT